MAKSQNEAESQKLLNNNMTHRTTNPAEPITLSEALAHLNADSSVETDAYVTALITVAREACEDRTERTMLETGWQMTLDRFQDEIELSHPPIISVDSVKYLDSDGVEQTVSPFLYRVDTRSEPGRIVLAPYATWPETEADAINAVTIDYSAGYSTVPMPLKQWMLLAIGEMYEMRSGSSDKPTIARGFADNLLRPYLKLGR